MGNRVKEKLADGFVVNGLLTYSGSPDFVATVASAGFDYIQVDHMFGAVTWEQSANMCRAAKLAGITPIVRLQTEPWIARGNTQVAIDGARALSVGFEGLTWSVTDMSEVEQVVQVAAGWHRDLASLPWTRENFKDYHSGLAGSTFVAPVIESPRALDMVEDIAAVPGVDAIFCGTTDLTVQLGHGMNAEHPEVWAAVDRTAAACHAKGIALWSNPGMGYATFPEMRARISRLLEHGVDIMFFQTLELLVKMGGEHVIEGFTDRRRLT